MDCVDNSPLAAFSRLLQMNPAAGRSERRRVRLSLRCRRPGDVTRPITMAEAGTIENDDAASLGS